MGYVLRAMECRHFCICGSMWKLIEIHIVATYITIHSSVESIINDELVRHFNPERFHRVLLAIIVRPNFIVIKVRYSFLHI